MAEVEGSRGFGITGEALWAVVADPEIRQGMEEAFDRLAGLIGS